MYNNLWWHKHPLPLQMGPRQYYWPNNTVKDRKQHTWVCGLQLIFKGLDTNEYTRKNSVFLILSIHSFIHYISVCRMQQFLTILSSFFHSSPLCTFSCHPSPPTILPSSFTSSCHLFLGLSLNLVVPKFIYNTLLGILFSSILCTYPNQCNLFNLIVSDIVVFLTLA